MTRKEGNIFRVLFEQLRFNRHGKNTFTYIIDKNNIYKKKENKLGFTLIIPQTNLRFILL